MLLWLCMISVKQEAQTRTDQLLLLRQRSQTASLIRSTKLATRIKFKFNTLQIQQMLEQAVEFPSWQCRLTGKM